MKIDDRLGMKPGGVVILAATIIVLVGGLTYIHSSPPRTSQAGPVLHTCQLKFVGVEPNGLWRVEQVGDCKPVK